MIKQLIRGVTGTLLLAAGTICILSTRTGDILDWTYSLIGGAMILMSIAIMVQFIKSIKEVKKDE